MKLSNPQIARELTLIAHQLPDDDFAEIRTVYTHGTFKIRARASRSAVLAVAARYARNRDFRTKRPPRSSGFPHTKLTPKYITQHYAHDADMLTLMELAK